MATPQLDDINFLYRANKDWQISLQVMGHYKNLNLLIGPPGSGKSTLLKYLVGDISKLSATSINGQIVETDNCLANLEIYSSKSVPLLVAKADDLYVECPDLRTNDLATSFFLQRLLHITRTVRIVFVIDYETVIDSTNNYKVLWSVLSEVARLITNRETITNVKMIVTKSCGYTDDQSTMKNLETALSKSVFSNCAASQLSPLDNVTKELYSKTAIMISSFKEHNIILFKTPIQKGPLSESKLFSSDKLRLAFDGVPKIDTKEFSFMCGVNLMATRDLRSMAERCHSAILKGLKSKITQFYNQQLLECGTDSLECAQILLKKTNESLAKQYTGQKCLEEHDTLNSQPYDQQKYQMYKQFFVIDIMEFHRTIMQFFKQEHTLSIMQNSAYSTIENILTKKLQKFPRWKKALEFLEQVDRVLSKDDYQTNRHLYNRRDIVEWGKPNVHARHGLVITPDNFRQFCMKISCNFTIDNLEEPFGLTYLNKIITEKLHDPFLKFITVDVNQVQNEEVVLVFGRTGVGKTSLIQHLFDGKLQSDVVHAATRYPRLVKIDGVFYIDCPSLAEVGRFENEVQIWITLKTILEKSKTVKLLYVVDCKTLFTADRQTILDSLKSWMMFMKNYEKHSDGLGCIVTKVDYTLNKSPENEIREFLAKVAFNHPVYGKLIKILLTKKTDTKIEYLFQWNAADAKFNETIAKRKNCLEKMIGHLKFIPSDPEDFIYSLSSKAKIKILSILIGNHLETHFIGRISVLSDDIFETNSKMDSIVGHLCAVRSEHLDFGENCGGAVSDFLKNIYNYVQIDTKIVEEIVELVNRPDGSSVLTVVTSIFKNHPERQCVLLNFGFEAIENYLGWLQKFTRFYIKLYEILSTYAVQSRKLKYRVTDASTTTPTADNFIDHRNIYVRLDQINGLKNFKDDHYTLDKDIHIQHVNKLLNFAFTADTNEMETHDKIEVTGNFLLTTHISKELLMSSTALFLYARNTIFIDRPIRTGHQRKVFIIAPKIELRIPASEVVDVFYVTQSFIDNGKSRGCVFGTYRTPFSDGMKLLYRYEVCARTFIDDYLAFLVNGQSNAFQEQRLWKFAEFIESDYEKVMRIEHGCDCKQDKYQRAKRLIRHFHYLEMLCRQTKNQNELLPRFKDMAKGASIQFNTDESCRTLVSHLYVALMTKIHSLENDSSMQLILDAKQYLEALRTNIDQYAHGTSAKEVRRIQHEYKQSVGAKISEGKTFIANELESKIESLFDVVNKNLEKLLTEVNNEQSKAEFVRQELLEMLEKLRQTMAMRNIFATLRGMTTVLGAFGLVTDKLTKIIDSSINMTEAIALPIVRIQDMPKYDLPHSVKDAISIQVEMVEKIRNKDFEKLQAHLETLLATADKFPNKNDKISADIDQMKKHLHEFKMEEQHLHYSVKYEKACRIAKAAEGLTKDLGKHLKPEHLKEMEVLNKMFNNWTSRMHLLQHIEEVRENLLSVDEDMEKLEQFREKVNGTMIPIMNDIQAVYYSCHRDVSKLTEVGLEVKTWQIKSAFAQFKNFCAQFTAGFKMHDHLMDCLRQLEDGSGILLMIHKRIQEYQKNAEIMEFYGQMSVTSNQVSDNETLNQLYHDLKMSINESIIIEQYNKGLNGFKQWAFPFAKVYLADLALPVAKCEASDQRFRALTTNAIANVQQIIDRTMQHNASVIRVRDSFVMECNFDGGALMPVLYTWQYRDHRDAIKNLLRGEEVKLVADIRTGVQFDAVKFSKIALQFCARTDDQQSAINAHLKEITIRLEHSGRSIYRFKNRRYLITTEPVIIQFSYARKENGEPTIRNEVYNKLALNHPVLSPYTEWRIQLSGVVESQIMDNMHIDLKLTGYGQYANVNEDIDLEVEKNYHKYIY